MPKTSASEYLISILDLDKKALKLEMERMDVHKAGISIMLPKAQFRTIKIKNVSVTKANIIKQDMLSFGGEVATAKGTINHSIKHTDVLIFGTIHQIKNLVSKLPTMKVG